MPKGKGYKTGHKTSHNTAAKLGIGSKKKTGVFSAASAAKKLKIRKKRLQAALKSTN